MDEIRVLIVEDDPMVADINKRFTTAVPGFAVVGVAADGARAIEMLRQLQPDLVILDVYMPQLNGLEVLAQLRQAALDVDVILITAANDSESVRLARQGGAVDYIVKPFKFDRYKNALERYREYAEKMKQSVSFSQAELDRVNAVPEIKEEKSLPKNLHPQTLGMIFNFLSCAREALSADEVAAEVGISRATARRYLEYLTENGKVKLQLEYVAVGRPVHRFILQTKSQGEAE